MAGQVVQAILMSADSNVELLKELFGENYEHIRTDMAKQEGATVVYTQKDRVAFKSISDEPIPVGDSGVRLVVGELADEKEAGLESPFQMAADTVTEEHDITWGDLLRREVYKFEDILDSAFLQTEATADQRRNIVISATDALKAFLEKMLSETAGKSIDIPRRESGQAYGVGDLATRIVGEVKKSLRQLAKKAVEPADKAVWSTAYINELPNSAFVVIEKGYDPDTDGMSDKRARHLPYKDADGNIDMPHLRNAFARANQIESVLGVESTEDLRARALKKCEQLRKKYMPDEKGLKGDETMADEKYVTKEELTAALEPITAKTEELTKGMGDSITALTEAVNGLKEQASAKTVEEVQDGNGTADLDLKTFIEKSLNEQTENINRLTSELETAKKTHAEQIEALQHAGQPHVEIEEPAIPNNGKKASATNAYFKERGWSG